MSTHRRMARKGLRGKAKGPAECIRMRTERRPTRAPDGTWKDHVIEWGTVDSPSERDHMVWKTNMEKGSGATGVNGSIGTYGSQGAGSSWLVVKCRKCGITAYTLSHKSASSKSASFSGSGQGNTPGGHRGAFEALLERMKREWPGTCQDVRNVVLAFDVMKS